MLRNAQNLTGLYTGFNAAFQQGLAMAAPTWNRVAMTAPSNTRTEEYGWLGKLPKIREWIGDRVVESLAAHSYAITNKPWELTIGVDVDDIDDDRFGIYSPLFQELGRETAVHPDRLVWQLLAAGNQVKCFDGQYFFDMDHPVLNAYGSTSSVSNYQGGAGAFWALLDTTRAIKPVIYQNRRSFEFRRMDGPTDEVAFSRKEYRYGIDGRNNVGFGFWQLAYGSRQTLNPANYEAARVAMQTIKRDRSDEFLGVTPKVLVHGPTLESAVKTLIAAPTGANGAANIWYQTVETLMVPWLG